jgi:branched-chain amino acid transport system substrate-binding protein
LIRIHQKTGAWAILLIAFALLGAACAQPTGEPGATTAPPTETTPPPTETTAPPTETTAPPAGELGEVTIAAGEPIKIGVMQAITGAFASLGQDQVTAIEVAVDDRGGELLGHPIELQIEDSACAAEAGTTGAERIVSDPQVIGVVGTSCSGAGVPASQILTEAGLVMISGSTTSPSLTALGYLVEGELVQQENNNPGFFRTAHNDEFQGAGAGAFAFEGAGAQTAATIHDGDPYTEGLTTQFGAFYEGEVVLATAINKGDTDMRPVLTEVAAAAPDVLFFPIFQPEGDFIVQQAPEFPELGDTQLMGADGLLSDTYVIIPETEGMVFSGPGQASGAPYEEFLQRYEEKAGTPPIQSFHAHAYDAFNILADAIEAIAQQDGDTLVIDRQALRDWIYDLEGYEGLTGTLACNQFGDCARPSIGVYENVDPSAGLAGVFANQVFAVDFTDQVDPEKMK